MDWCVRGGPVAGCAEKIGVILGYLNGLQVVKNYCDPCTW